MNEHKDPQNDVIDDFTPGPLPPPGMPSMTRPPPLPPAPPRLCELGPCRHYHTIDIVLDSQQPLDGTPGRIDIKTHRSCYAQVGVDTDLTDVPVVRCSRWDPEDEDGAEVIQRTRRQRDALRSEEGAVYMRKYNAWDLEMAARNGESPDPSVVDAAGQVYAASQSPLIAHMIRIHGSAELPPHVTGEPATGPCAHDCPRCKLHALAMQALLEDEERDNDPELGMPHYVTYKHVIAMHQGVKVVKTLGYTEEGEEYIVAVEHLEADVTRYAALALLALGTELTERDDGTFAPKEGK